MTIQRTFNLSMPVSEDTIILGSKLEWRYGVMKFDKSYTIEFHPSAGCVYSCPHCQGYSSTDSWGRDRPKLKTEVIDDFFKAYDDRRNKSIGLWRIIISGLCGEPLLNKQATKKILEEGKNRGLSMGLSTSGLLLDESLIDILMCCDTPQDWVNISLDSAVGDERGYSAAHGRVQSLSKVLRNLEELALAKVRRQAIPQINIDWIISDLNVKPESIEEDLVSTITYLNGIQGINLLRLQFPFYFDASTPRLSEEASTSLARALERLQSGRIGVKDIRPDFNVWLRNNWFKRIKGVRSCRAASEYGPVIGPDGIIYHCPYLAAPNFNQYNLHLKEIDVHNLWDEITGIPALDTRYLAKCQVVCGNKNNFLDNNIVESID
jgi:MoaA/NifB/PqqE/SkfB family radical SAM enzyme